MERSSPKRWMRRAIGFSRKGFPAPNPRVGCVIVRDGSIAGEGWHEYAGAPHAEIVALERAGHQARGATVYVTLEPCNHHGKTPPCTEALLAAGVLKVVVATPDPNPVAAGGLCRLKDSGVETESGLLSEEAEKANRIWLFAMRMGRPFVVAKSAVSLDGRVALPSGEGKWITGPSARKMAHRLRAELGAVLVGRGTVQTDDPKLTARIPGVTNQPLRVVLDPESKLTGKEAVFNQPGETLWVTARASKNQIEAPSSNHEFDLRALMRILWDRGVTGLLVEGGPRTISSFFKADLVDRVDLFVAPKVLGQGPVWLEGAGQGHLEGIAKLNSPKTRKLGPDLWISGDILR